MKLTKAEKIWLFTVILFFVLYNLPFIPGYDNPYGTLIHGLFTLLPLWISVYVGLFCVCKNYNREGKASKEQEREKKQC